MDHTSERPCCVEWPCTFTTLEELWSGSSGMEMEAFSAAEVEEGNPGLTVLGPAELFMMAFPARTPLHHLRPTQQWERNALLLSSIRTEKQLYLADCSSEVRAAAKAIESSTTWRACLETEASVTQKILKPNPASADVMQLSESGSL
ncbi:hypothetical protein WMY93_012472 [Mugilogobius chulae]|uniref:Uncharacterized protein n=1 Tax=Mugilogobius chulae TaxID=88201 RepID=A0AAW0PGW5_9GOBI